MFYLVNLTLINYNNEKLGFELNLNINLFIKDQRDNYQNNFYELLRIKKKN